MNTVDTTHEPQEIELKLALPTSDPSGLLTRLSRNPVLARRRATRAHLHNVYYDTPEQALRRQRIALRIRRVGDGAQAQWLQTLKMGGSGLSALSQRGEWEAPVAGAALDPALRAATPWAAFDPDGIVFGALVPVFVTSFERTSWLVRRRDRSVVEVALDVGQVTAGDKVGPICELELELKAGTPGALFELAQQLAAAVVVMPVASSKSERGYSLADGTLEAPLRARSPALTPELSLQAAAQRLLREMFCQVTTNLNTMRKSDDPEVLHQARVGWRRFRSAWRLLASSLPNDAPPSWEPLRPLMALIGEQRDLDVALTETLPALGKAFIADDERRAQDWQVLELAIGNSCTLRRQAVRGALEDPAVGATLVRTTQWIESLADDKAVELELAQAAPAIALRDWARRRINRLDNRLRAAIRQGDSPENQHRVRIVAKRLRYGIEALRSLLPKKSTQRLYREATELQTRIGAARDLLQASVIAARLEADRGLVEFLRGAAVGHAS